MSWFVLALPLVLVGVWYVRVGRLEARSDRDWTDDCAVTPTVDITHDSVTIHGVRDFRWRSTRDYDVRWTDERYLLEDLVGIGYFVEHFHWIRGMAHTMLAFEFRDGRVLVASFEVRRERGERFHPWPGLWRAYELTLIWGTEADVVRLRTDVRRNRVYRFECVVPPGKGQALLLQLCERTNALAATPEWYNTLTTTCTTNLVQAVNRVSPGRVPFVWRILLPGHSPRAAHRLGLIVDRGGYDATLAAAELSSPRSDADPPPRPDG